MCGCSVFLCLNAGCIISREVVYMKEVQEKTTLTLTINKKLKKQFAQLCEDIGLPMGAVAAAMIGQAVRKQEVKLSSLDLNGFTPEEAAELRRRVKEVSEGRGKLYAMAGE